MDRERGAPRRRDHPATLSDHKFVATTTALPAASLGVPDLVARRVRFIEPENGTQTVHKRRSFSCSGQMKGPPTRAFH